MPSDKSSRCLATSVFDDPLLPLLLLIGCRVMEASVVDLLDCDGVATRFWTLVTLLKSLLGVPGVGLVSTQPTVPDLAHFRHGGVPSLKHLILDLLHRPG